MNDLKAVQGQILHGDAHGLGHSGRRGALELETVAPASANHQEVQLSALVSRPEEALIAFRAQALYHLFDEKRLPGRA